MKGHAEAHEVAGDPKLELATFYNNEADKQAVPGAESHAMPKHVTIKHARNHTNEKISTHIAEHTHPARAQLHHGRY